MSPIKRILKRAIGDSGEDSGPTALVSADTATYFFISGHPRSGTNWLSALMNLHPKVYCHGEFHFQVLRSALDHFTALPWYLAHHDPVRSEAERAFADLVARCLRAQGQCKPGATVIGDHTPRAVRLLIPDAKYLVMVRDGRDVLVSWTYHLLRTGRPEVVHETVRAALAGALTGLDRNAPDSLRSAADGLLHDQAWVRHFAQQWSQHVSKDLATMVEWQQRGGPQSMCVTYERLHASTETERARLYSFLGVEPTEALTISAESRTAPGFGRDDPASFYRKGEVGDWSNHLCDARERWFVDVAAETMSRMGYLKHPSKVDTDHGATREAVKV